MSKFNTPPRTRSTIDRNRTECEEIEFVNLEITSVRYKLPWLESRTGQNQ